jgi:four helix bundle protein
MKATPLDIRQRTFIFALETLRCCKKIQEQEKEYILTRQLSRSATSVGANVREARNAESKADFIHKLSISQKECDESLYWIELMKEFVATEQEQLVLLHNECQQILKIVKTIIIRTKQNANWQKR